ncbi:MAG TPA: TIGR00341 family protein [Methanoregulaceae archaeon]|jgi:uncharacterized hydrophobic protein (TIGR00271 family)|nr:TIGR00341 family protein [Methanoregulaceae archaeon]
MDMVSEWVTKNRFDPEYLPVMEEKLFFEGEQKKRSITNYIVLLTLATIIATYGVISGSTATVIGAMIIAPLMTPIMAATLAMVLGRAARIKRSILVVTFSALYVIGLALLLSLFISPIVIGFGSNPEIISRVSPNLLALFVALASGAAGAFAISREDVGDTLPGVAIAISLVPPLSVVGISLSKLHWGDASGAFVLFLTNFLAIILAGGAVLWLSGVSISRITPQRDANRKRAFEVAILATIIVAIILGFNGYRTLEQERDTAFANTAVTSWIEGTSYTVTRLTLNFQPRDILLNGPAHVTISIAGTGELKSIDELAKNMEDALGYPVTIQLDVLPTQVKYYPRLLRQTASG